MKGLLVFTVFVISLVSSAVLPSREGTCGPTNKITYSETVLPSTQIDDYQLYFVSGNNQIIFLRTMDGHIYRSGDEGKTWVKQTVPEIMANIDSDSSRITRMFHTQVKDGSITSYFLGGNSKVWISTDGGVTYTYHNNLPIGVFYLYPSSSYPGLVIARRAVGNTHEIWKGNVLVPKGSEVNWTKIADNLPSHAVISWSNFANTNPNRLYIMRYVSATHNRYDCVIVYSEDFFQTETVLQLKNVLTWYHIDPDKFVAITCSDGVSCASKKMYISEDGGTNFHLSVFPDYRQDTPDESNFYVFEITDDAIWTRVERSCTYSPDLCWGDMFHSDAGDKAFTLSLPYQRQWDFTKYNSVEGIYVANQYLTGGGQPEPGDAIRSLITFNKGSNWTLITPPPKNAKGQPFVDADGKPCTTSNGCSLHIHGWSSPDIFTYFYSIPNATGLMIASGNVGKKLEERGDDINLYISTDGGSNWVEVREGTWVPEIGDHGSIIAIIDAKKQTNEVIYTVNNPDDLNEWYSCKFADANNTIIARNIRVSEGWDSTRFILYGQKKNLTTSEWHAIVIHLNFDKEFSGKCTADDFEKWSPKEVTGHCVMGRATYYYRRKKGRTCFISEESQKKIESTNCECRTEDYECDHCFFRPTLGAPCQLQCNVPNLPADPPLCANSAERNPIFFTTDAIGFRLVDGDTCDSSIPTSEKPKVLIPCKYNGVPPSKVDTPTSQTSVMTGPVPIITAVVLLVLVVVCGLWYLWRTSPTFYKLVRDTFGIDDGREIAYENPGESLADDDDQLEIPLDDDEADGKKTDEDSI